MTKKNALLSRIFNLTVVKSKIPDLNCVSRSQFRQVYLVIKHYDYEFSKIRPTLDIISNLIKYNVECNYLERFILLNTKFNKKNSLESYKLRYGDMNGELLYNEKTARSAITLQNMIVKYGDEIGRQKWDSYRNKQSYVGCKLEYFVEKYGTDEGTKRFKEIGKKKNSFRRELFSNDEEFERRKLKCSITLDGMIAKYGESEGSDKFNKHNDWLRNSKNRTSSQLQWWIDKGFTRQEAEPKLRDRQQTFTKEKLIEKHGETEGLRLWTERQSKWQNTLKMKPLDEIARINKAKALGGINALKNQNTNSPFISKPELELVKTLIDSGFDINQQFCLNRLDSKHYFYDINYEDKIIEFNGDYWHANPNKFNSDHIFTRLDKRITAKQIWNDDKNKIELAESVGYKTLVIWEFDWKHNKADCISRCIQFLNS